MGQDIDFIKVISKNEQEANRFAARCMLMIAGLGLLAWILDFMGIFIEPIGTMSKAMGCLVFFYILPTFFWRIDKWWIKYVIEFLAILGIGAIAYIIDIGIIAYCVPLIISCHYYSAKLIWITLVLSQFFYSITDLIHAARDPVFAQGMTLGEYSLTTLLPKVIMLFGIAAICIPLAGRTERMLVKEAEESADRERLSTELDIATQIQADMLPSIFPYLPEREEFDIYASMTPAKEVGGDFYDFYMVDDDHLALVMEDVSGKGVPAALFMVISKTLIKNAGQQGMTPKEILESVNDTLMENNTSEMFVTVWVGILDINTGVMTCSNAGHEFPAIRRKGGQFELFQDTHGLVLGAMDGIPYKEYEIQLEEGDELFVYTDGVPEATDAMNELFGTDRMLAALNKSERDCKDILACVKNDVAEFVGEAEQFDDLTMLAMRYKR